MHYSAAVLAAEVVRGGDRGAWCSLRAEYELLLHSHHAADVFGPETEYFSAILVSVVGQPVQLPMRLSENELPVDVLVRLLVGDLGELVRLMVGDFGELVVQLLRLVLVAFDNDVWGSSAAVVSILLVVSRRLLWPVALGGVAADCKQTYSGLHKKNVRNGTF